MIVEKRVEHDARRRFPVRGDHQIHILTVQGGQGLEGQPCADIHVNLGPGVAEHFKDREQPVETGVAFDGDVQPPSPPGPKRAKLLFHRVDLGQDTFGGAQHPVPGGRQAHRF